MSEKPTHKVTVQCDDGYFTFLACVTYRGDRETLDWTNGAEDMLAEQFPNAIYVDVEVLA
jgi:hypothetical protein